MKNQTVKPDYLNFATSIYIGWKLSYCQYVANKSNTTTLNGSVHCKINNCMHKFMAKINHKLYLVTKTNLADIYQPKHVKLGQTHTESIICLMVLCVNGTP